MPNPNWIDKWSAEDLRQLVYKRQVERKSFAAIAIEMGQNEGSCGRRYREIVAARPLEAPRLRAGRRPTPLYEELGIATYVHMQAILIDPAGILGNKRRMADSHTYRMPITLAKVFHEAS